MLLLPYHQVEAAISPTLNVALDQVMGSASSSFHTSFRASHICKNLVLLPMKTLVYAIQL